MKRVDYFSSIYKEESWNNYYVEIDKLLNALPSNILSDEARRALDDIDIPLDIKRVIIFHNREFAGEWLNSKIPVLDKKRPIDLLKTEKGTKAVKVALLRMPC